VDIVGRPLPRGPDVLRVAVREAPNGKTLRRNFGDEE
jgi:hypothetical protein